MKKIEKKDWIRFLGCLFSICAIFLTGYLVNEFFVYQIASMISGQWPTATMMNEINIPSLHYPIADFNLDVLLVMFGATSIVLAFGIGLTVGGIWLIGNLMDSLINKDENEWFADLIAEKVKEKLQNK